MAREEETMIDKACEWLERFCSENYIMNYTDCCEIPTEQVIESFKKWMDDEYCFNKEMFLKQLQKAMKGD